MAAKAKGDTYDLLSAFLCARVASRLADLSRSKKGVKNELEKAGNTLILNLIGVGEIRKFLNEHFVGDVVEQTVSSSDN